MLRVSILSFFCIGVLGQYRVEDLPEGIDSALLDGIFGPNNGASRYGLPVIDDCTAEGSDAICSNHGSCTDGACSCTSPYSGTYCQENELAKNLCKNEDKCAECMAFRYHMDSHAKLTQCLESCKKFTYEETDDMYSVADSDDNYVMCKHVMQAGCDVEYAVNTDSGKPYLVPRSPHCKSSSDGSASLNDGDFIGIKAHCSDKYDFQQPNGYGFLTYKEGDSFNRESYRGEWVCGKRHGRGVLLWKDGASFWGEFTEDVRDSTGVMIYPNGDTYNGNWTNGDKNGHGTYIWLATRDIYIGNFKNGVKEGYGKLIFGKSKTVFTGIFANDGIVNGLYTFFNKDTFEGDRDQGLYTEGCSGNTYTGSFSDGNFHGQGVYTWADGSTYTGSFVNSKPEGQGEYISNDIHYTGKFRNGKVIHKEDECMTSDITNTSVQSYVQCAPPTGGY